MSQDLNNALNNLTDELQRHRQTYGVPNCNGSSDSGPASDAHHGTHSDIDEAHDHQDIDCLYDHCADDHADCDGSDGHDD